MNWIASRRAVIFAMIAAMCVSIACGGAKPHTDAVVDDRRNEVEALWAQIQQLEKQANYDDDIVSSAGSIVDADITVTAENAPRPASTRASSRSPLKERKWCHENNDERDAQCGDVCELAGAICVNATSICRIAHDLKDEQWANQKCNSATMSCTRADNRCCQCGS